MIIASPSDYHAAAKRKLPRFLFDFLDGGSSEEQTLNANISDLQKILFRQRILQNINDVNLEIELFGKKQAMPIVIGPVGLMGMYARRGEVQAAKAAEKKGVPFTLPTLSICSIEEVASQSTQPLWFQLYLLKDRGFVKNVLERAQAAGIENLIVTVDLPPGPRWRDPHSGMSGPYRVQRRILQALMKPRWAYDVGIRGRPHELGNISSYLGEPLGLEDFSLWSRNTSVSSLSWADLEWVRNQWAGRIIIKGILDPQDAKDAVKFGAEGIVVSNHGGRQLDGVQSTVKALPPIVDAVGNDLTVLVDSGVRSGLDVLRMLALGAKAVMIGRPVVYALTVQGQLGVENLLSLYAREIQLAMPLVGVSSLAQVNRSILNASC